MSEWLIELRGTESDIEFLSRFLSRTPFRIEDGPTAKALTLPGVPPDADSESVQVAANTLIEVVNGATRLYNAEFSGVSFVKVTRLGDDGKWHGYGYLALAPRSTNFTICDDRNEILGRWVSTGLLDEDATRALALYGSLEPNWKNLYLVSEVIMENVGGQAALEEKGWVPTSQIGRFKQTANSYRAIGREARHAKMSYEPPAETMSLEDAHELVRTILTKWIEWRESQSG